MVLGHHPKQYKHMMKNLVSSLIEHERIQTTHGKAKHLARAANKLIHFAKKAEKGFTSPANLIQGRVATDRVKKKLLMEIVPRLENVPQNYIKISKNFRFRRGDNSRMVNVSIRGNEAEELAKTRLKEAREKLGEVDKTAYNRKVLNQEKVFYEKMAKEHPQKAQFFKKKLARVQFQLWVLDRPLGEKRLAILV